MKKLISMLLCLSIVLSFAVMPVSAEDEELKVYFYEDFVTGYEENETKVKGFNGVERTLVNGEYVLHAHHNQSGYANANFGRTVQVPDEVKAVVEYKLSGVLYGGSNSIGFNASSGIPTVYVDKTTVKAYGYNDKTSITSCDTANGVTVTVVYDNEKPERDIFINGKYIGHYGMGSSSVGSNFCDKNSLPLNFYNHISSGTTLYYHYVKVYQAPSDYNPETFVPGLYKNVGKEITTSTGVIPYDDNFCFNLINSFGFYNEGDDGAFVPAEPMTRLQFAGILARILNVSPATNPVQLYSDVARRHYMSGNLQSLNEMGIMSGIGAKEFGPEVPVTAPMIAAALVRALGYKEFAEYYSGYETGYIKMAKDAGIFKGVSISEPLNAGDAARCLYNFMNAEIYETVKTDGKTFTKDSVSGNTVLKVYHNIAGIRGVLSSNEYTSLSDKNGAGEGLVVIAGKSLTTDSKELNGMLGYETEAYYDIDTNKIMFASVTDKNSAEIIEATSYISYADGTVTYEKDARDGKIKLPSDADIIYNGKAAPFTASLLEGVKNGKFIFLDNNNDNKTDVLFINSYVNMVVESKSIVNETVNYKNSKGFTDLKKYESYVIRNSAGSIVSLSGITSGNVVSVFESLDKTHAEFAVSDFSYIGDLEEIYGTDSGWFYKIDGETVMADSDFYNENPVVRAGISGEFFVDAFGKIAYYSEVVSKDFGYAYIIKVKRKEQMSETVMVKMFTEYKELLVLDTAEKVIIDGEAPASPLKLLSYEQLYNVTSGADGSTELGAFKPQIISYRLDSEGKIKEIDTSLYNEGLEDSKNSIQHVASGSMRYDSLDKQFWPNAYFNSNNMIFVIRNTDPEADDPRDFSVTTSNIFSNENSYNVKLYKTSDDTLGVDLGTVISGKGGGMDSYSHLYVVSGISDAYYEKEGRSVKKVSYFLEGRERSCYVTDEEYAEQFANGTYEVGDAMIFGINSDNELNSRKLLYDADADTDGDDSTVQVKEVTRTHNTIHRVYSGYLYQLKEKLITIVKDVNDPESDKEVHRVPDYVYVVDTAKGKVRKADITELVSYETDSEAYSKVTFYDTKGYDYDLVIYK